MIDNLNIKEYYRNVVPSFFWRIHDIYAHYIHVPMSGCLWDSRSAPAPASGRRCLIGAS